MMSRSRRLVLVAAAGTALGSVAHAQTLGQREVLVVDDAGAHLQVEYGKAAPADPAPPAETPEIIWSYRDLAAIGESTAVADEANDVWAYWDLNSERVSLFDKEGDGTPVFEFDLEPEDMQTASVASAEEATLGVVRTVANNTGVLVRGFDRDGGADPIWQYDFPDNVDGSFGNAATVHYVDVSSDGSIVAAVGGDTAAEQTYVAIIDGATGQEITGRIFPERISAVELSDSGDRAVLTAMSEAVVIDTGTLEELHRFGVSGTGSFHRISRDGRTAAAGGFNFAAWRDDGNGNWQLAASGSQSSNWFGAPAVSGDGETLFVASHNYATGYIHLTYRVIDLNTGNEIARTETIGSGGLQDSVKVAQANDDGTIFSIASWGTQDNAHPEVQVFDRDLERIAGVDTDGSPFHIDMTRDGSVVSVAAKAVHANTFGSGGDVIAYRVLEDDCPADLTGDGQVDTADFFLFLDLFAAGDPDADFTGDGTVDVNDFFAFLDAFAQGC